MPPAPIGGTSQAPAVLNQCHQKLRGRRHQAENNDYNGGTVLPRCVPGSSIGQRFSAPGRIGSPINLTGTQVETGDVIIRDRDGLVLVKANEVRATLTSAEAREAKEEDYRRQIAEGVSTAELLGLLPTLERYGR